jgi:hypothetical protein
MLETVFLLFFLSLGNKTIFCFPIKIHFKIAFLIFSYTITILFIYKIQVLTYPQFFHKILTQSSIKDKKIKEEKG